MAQTYTPEHLPADPQSYVGEHPDGDETMRRCADIIHNVPTEQTVALMG
jgi:hypothetical protein